MDDQPGALNTTAIVAYRVVEQTPTGEAHPAQAYIASLARGSQRTMRESLRVMARIVTNNPDADERIAWWAFPVGHAQGLRSSLREHYSAATVNKMLSAFRGVMRECWRQGLLDADTYQRLISVKSVDGTTLPAGREIQSGELVALMRVCSKDATLAGRRDAALIALLYVGGLRRAEIAAVTLANWRPAMQALDVTGKRNKQRTVYVADTGAFVALTDWLQAYGRADADAPLFPRLHKGGGYSRLPLTAQGVYHILMGRASEAKLEHLSPHDFRRTFVGDLLERGADIVTVQKLAGHANVNTTARYDRRPEETKRKAAALLTVPYQPPARPRRAPTTRPLAKDGRA